MSDHEFEKKIQVQMEELKFRPSDAVWKEVEKNIRRDKRRRRLLLWIPIAATLLITGGYFMYSANHESTQVLVRETKNNTTSLSRENTTQTTIPATGITPEHGTQQIEPATGNSTRNHPPVVAPSSGNAVRHQPGATDAVRIPSEQLKEQAPQQPFQTGNRKEKNNKTNGYQKAGKGSITKKGNNNNKETGNTTIATPLTVSTEPVQEPAQQQVIAAVPAPSDPKPQDISLTDSIAEETDKLIALDSAVVKQVAPIERKPKQRVSKWQWGVQAGGGVSNISNDGFFQFKDLLSMEKSTVADVGSYNASNPQNGPNASAYAININPPVNAKPSSIEPGPSFSISGFVQRSLSRRFSIAGGLQYTYASVHTTVGNKVEKSRVVNIGQQSSVVVNRYYSNSNAAVKNPYTYRYHFIELPVYINWQLNKARRIPPVTWNAGFSVSRLISTNALHYDGINGVYFKDNSLFNKTQFAVTSGLQVGLLQKNRYPIWVGPAFGYHLTGLIQKDISDRQYLWSAGLRLKMILKK